MFYLLPQWKKQQMYLLMTLLIHEYNKEIDMFKQNLIKQTAIYYEIETLKNLMFYMFQDELDYMKKLKNLKNLKFIHKNKKSIHTMLKDIIIMKIHNLENNMDYILQKNIKITSNIKQYQKEINEVYEIIYYILYYKKIHQFQMIKCNQFDNIVDIKNLECHHLKKTKPF